MSIYDTACSSDSGRETARTCRSGKKLVSQLAPNPWRGIALRLEQEDVVARHAFSVSIRFAVLF